MEVKKRIILVVTILILTIGGVLVFKMTRNKQNQPVPPDGAAVDIVKQREFEDALQQIAVTDQDFDGLSDSEEQRYKTDSANSDTDNDGLNDWQEIAIYKTDPLKLDTDGDTYADGYEVRRGFSPTGAGTL